MNFIDLLLFIILVWYIWMGVRRGFILSTIEMLSWLGSLLIAFVAYKPFGALLLNIFPGIGFFSAALAFIILIIIARIILDRVADHILMDIPLHAHTSILNKILGIVPGAVNGYIWAALLAAFLLVIPFTNPLSEEVRGSKLANALVGKTSWLDDRWPLIFGGGLNPAAHSHGTEAGEEKFRKLPFSVDHPEVRADLEGEMLQLVNKERISRGIAPLKADPELTIVARKHSVDMLQRGYFSHYTPEGADPFERMQKNDIYFRSAGENVAFAQTLFLAHYGLMHSPGHRANILNPSFGRLGIGIEDGGIYGLMITQDFRN